MLGLSLFHEELIALAMTDPNWEWGTTECVSRVPNLGTCQEIFSRLIY